MKARPATTNKTMYGRLAANRGRAAIPGRLIAESLTDSGSSTATVSATAMATDRAQLDSPAHVERQRHGPLQPQPRPGSDSRGGDRLDIVLLLIAVGEGIPELADCGVESGFKVDEGVVRPEALIQLPESPADRGVRVDRQDAQGFLLQPNARPVLANLTGGQIYYERTELELRRAGNCSIVFPSRGSSIFGVEPDSSTARHIPSHFHLGLLSHLYSIIYWLRFNTDSNLLRHIDLLRGCVDTRGLTGATPARQRGSPGEASQFMD